MRTVALVVFSLAFPYSVQASGPTSQADAAKTLDKAIFLAGPSIAGLPIVLAAVPPDEASRGVEAWTLPTAGRARRTNRRLQRERALSLRQRPRSAGLSMSLEAGVDHHPRSVALQAWSGRSGAYDAQIAYLTTRGGAGYMIAGVRLARDRVLSAQQAIERRRK